MFVSWNWILALDDISKRIWDATDYTCIDTLTGHDGSVLCLHYDEEILVSGSSDRCIFVWDMATHKHQRTLAGHTNGVLDVGFDGQHIVSGSKVPFSHSHFSGARLKVCWLH
jgi:F-box and WD-40 domain protein 1/11